MAVHMLPLLLLVAFLVSSTVVITATKQSPRHILVRLLHDAGCTNKLVAHYIIDMYNSQYSTNEMIDRLSGATGKPIIPHEFSNPVMCVLLFINSLLFVAGYDTGRVAAWLTVVTTHQSA